MFNKLCNCVDKPLKIMRCVRYLSSTEISTALRPFYFTVHPDLFGKHPNQRLVNENSLKQLSLFIETIQTQRPVVPCNLQFYLRETQNVGKFQVVNIQLREPNVRNTIHTILKSCNLSTKYLDEIAPPNPVQKIEFPIKPPKYPHDYDIFGTVIVKRKIKTARDAVTLSKWLEENYKSAIEKFEKNAPMRKDIDILCKDICKTYQISEVRWDCGWNETHFRGCLQSFLALARENPKSMEELRDRTLVFAAFTGLSTDGHILLNSGEVRNNWLDFIKNVKKHDKVLLRIPSFEKALSQVLKDIKVVRRKFMLKILAGDYEKNVCKLMTTLGDYRGTKGYPSNWPNSLKHHEIVVETEAGPLMVSPTGQFIVPSTCPGFLLVNFITDHLEEAEQKANEYKAHKHIEKFLHAQCIKEFELNGLKKDDNVNPEVMIKCCERLLEVKDQLHLLRGLNLSIATYYSVLSDGTVCIPTNWKL